MLLKSILLCVVFSVSFAAVVRHHKHHHAGHKPSYTKEETTTSLQLQEKPCHCSQASDGHGWGRGGGGGGGGGDKFGMADMFWNFGGTKLSRVLDGRLDGQASFIDSLETELKAIENLTEDIVDTSKMRAMKVREMELRMDKLEGTDCAADSFQCGGDFRHCINIILVCDGLKDCDTGRDEDEDLCQTLTPVGTTLIGNVVGPDDCTTRKPRTFHIFITHADSPHSYYVVHKHVKGVATLTSYTGAKERKDTVLIEGKYEFANRRLVIEPPEDDDLNMVCQFDGIHDNRCVASISNTESADNTCMKFMMEVKQI